MEYHIHMLICSDIYNIIANYLPIQDSMKLQYLCKNLFELKMEHYIFGKYNIRFLEKHLESIVRLEIFDKRKIYFLNDQINDKVISKFRKLKYVILLGNSNITDNGLIHLKGIHTLKIKNNTKITDNGLEYITGVHILELNSNDNMTDNGLVHLKGIHTLKLNYSINITDNGLAHLKGIHTLKLGLDRNITDD